MAFQDQVLEGDVIDQLRKLPGDLVDCVVTSPPYWSLRDYEVEGQIGMEPHPNDYINKLVQVFREVRRVLKPTGTVFLNLGDTYYIKSGSNFKGSNDSYSAQADKVGIRAGNQLRELFCDGKWLQSKQKLMLPERIAIAMQDEGWILRNSIVWYKPNHMPSSVTDRLTGSYESVFFFTKQQAYYFNLNAIRRVYTEATYKRISEPNVMNQTGGTKQATLRGLPESKGDNASKCNLMVQGLAKKVLKHDLAVGRMGNFSYSDPLHTKPNNPSGANPGDVWSLTLEPSKIAHIATFPTKLVKLCLKCGCPADGLVLDPFAGSGTTLYVARKMAYHYLGIELKPEYVELARARMSVFSSRLDTFIAPAEPLTFGGKEGAKP